MTDPIARALAALCYDQHLTLPGDTDTTRRKYITDLAADPHVTRLLSLYPHIATVCDSCGHGDAEDLRWLGADGRTALCRSLTDCKQRHAAKETNR